jgi:hypothetical protein
VIVAGPVGDLERQAGGAPAAAKLSLAQELSVSPVLTDRPAAATSGR